MDGVEVIADRPRRDAFPLPPRIRVCCQPMYVYGLLLGAAGEWDNDARVVYLPGRADDDAGMLINEFRVIRIVREIDPEILTDTRCAGDQPLAPADADPACRFQLIIGWERPEWADGRRVVGFRGHDGSFTIRPSPRR